MTPRDLLIGVWPWSLPDGTASHGADMVLKALDVAGFVIAEKAEVEQLRAALATYSKDTEATENRIIDAEFAAQEWQAEVERLKADMAGDQQRLFHCEAEIKQLRELTYGGYKEGKP